MNKRTIKLEISYDGTDYAGWQTQTHQNTIQKTLEMALSTIANQKVRCVASGRTDSGVHARKQVVTFEVEQSQTPLQAFTKGANAILPSSIRVLDAVEVPNGYSAITEAKSKVYRYFFRYAKRPNVFLQRFVWQVSQPLDIEQMQEASQVWVGEHDFKCFATHGVVTKTTVREIYSIEFLEPYPEVFCMQVHGSGFLRHMIRAMMGTLVEVGNQKRSADSLKTLIDHKDRTQAGPTAPPHGLFLWDVVY